MNKITEIMIITATGLYITKTITKGAGVLVDRIYDHIELYKIKKQANHIKEVCQRIIDENKVESE